MTANRALNPGLGKRKRNFPLALGTSSPWQVLPDPLPIGQAEDEKLLARQENLLVTDDPTAYFQSLEPTVTLYLFFFTDVVVLFQSWALGNHVIVFLSVFLYFLKAFAILQVPNENW